MESLSEVQRECLQRLAHQPESSQLPCSSSVLEQLHRLGMVERVTRGWLPLENPQTRYVISGAGKALLERLARQ